MTRRELLRKWTAYGLAFILVWLAERALLGRWPVLGVTPVLMPIASVAVAFLEGPIAGAGFGIAAGVVCTAAYFGSHGGMCLFLSVMGAAVGLATQYGLSQNAAGHLICSAGVLVLRDLGGILVRLLRGQSAGALFATAGKEIFWSLCFAPLIYLLFRAVHRRVGRPD